MDRSVFCLSIQCSSKPTMNDYWSLTCWSWSVQKRIASCRRRRGPSSWCRRSCPTGCCSSAQTTFRLLKKQKKIITVKTEYNDHLWDHPKQTGLCSEVFWAGLRLVVVDRWSLTQIWRLTRTKNTSLFLPDKHNYSQPRVANILQESNKVNTKNSMARCSTTVFKFVFPSILCYLFNQVWFNCFF